MRHILAFLGSLAVAILVTAAGLYFDKETLAAFGVALIGFVTILWLYDWGRAAQRRAATAHASETESDQTRDGNVRGARRELVLTLHRARQRASLALGNRRDARGLEGALAESNAALLSAKSEIGIPLLPDMGSERQNLEARARLIETVLPYIRQSHDDEARQAAKDFASSLRRVAS